MRQPADPVRVLHDDRLIEASSFSSLPFSAVSIMPAASNRISAMLPGTIRSIVNTSTEIPNSVRSIKKKRLIR